MRIMESENKIQEFVISFFRISNFQISEKSGVYTVWVPEINQNYFQKSKLVFTFDEKISNEVNCDLIIPGSKILFQIMTLCSNKGSIVKKRTKYPTGTIVVRYHFFVHFSSTSNTSKLFSLDVDLQTLQLANVIGDLTEHDFVIKPESLLENVTKSYIVALDNLKEKSDTLKNDFVNSNQSKFQNDYDTFVNRFNDEIRELDNSINEKEKTTDDFEKIKKYRFMIMDKITNLEKEKNELSDNLEKKYKINLNYNLIACELILC
jgi:hypothetical protein